MRIAQITLPVYSNDHRHLVHTHEALSNDLLVLFGGFTVVDGQGAWKDGVGTVYAEPVKVYSVAYEPGKDHAEESIRGVAKRAGRGAQQIAMFIVLDGEAEFISL